MFVRVSYFTFPNRYYIPTQSRKFFGINLVSFAVGSDFINPKLCICFWRVSIFATLVPMPETAVQENYSFVFRQNNIGFSGQLWNIHAIPKAPYKKGFAQCQFGFCIL
jgi:hypothetical protein